MCLAAFAETTGRLVVPPPPTPTRFGLRAIPQKRVLRLPLETSVPWAVAATPVEPAKQIDAPCKTTPITTTPHPAITAKLRLPEEVSDPTLEPLLETKIPRDYVPWWQEGALRPLRLSSSDMPIGVNSLVIAALKYSAQIQAISDNTLIAETSITRAAAEFDVRAFMESKLIRTSIPTGSTLEAGFNMPRLREADWFHNAGVRKKNTYGGRFEVSQQIGTRDSNSQFFSPLHQANARLTLGYNQPLLNGAGKAYNNSLIVLADIDTRIASNRTVTELQDHLLAVTESMWELYHQRTVLLQKQRHLQRDLVILDRLEKRRGIDSLESQVLRARAAVSMRRAELIRADTSIRNAEAQVRALVNSPAMLANRQSELIPIDPPTREFIPVSMEDAVLTALENRAELNSVTQEIEAARVRLKVAKNEILPVLDVVLETYVSGLRGDYAFGNAFSDQFGVGEPSYTAGLVFEVPIHRRAAKANLQRRQIELRQLSSRLQATIETLHADVEIAVREVETSFREMQARYSAMVAADADVRYLQRRWEELPGDDRAASFLLADLLDAQDRLVLEEFGFARSHVDYGMSLNRLNRATGTLLKFEQIELIHASEDCLPKILFEKSAAPPNGPVTSP